MPWTNLPVVDETGARRSAPVELRQKLILLAAVDGVTFNPIEPAGAVDTREVLWVVAEGLQRMLTTTAPAQRKYFWNGTGFVTKTWAEFCADVGVGTLYWLTPQYQLGTYYNVGDLVRDTVGTWGDRVWECTVAHTATEGRAWAYTDTRTVPNWRQYDIPLRSTLINEAYAMLDYMKNYGWSRRAAGSGCSVYNWSYSPYYFYDPTTWGEMRAAATAYLNGQWTVLYPAGQTVTSLQTPRGRAYGSYRTPPPPNDPFYRAGFLCAWRPGPWVLSTADWHADLKRSGCAYKLTLGMPTDLDSFGGAGVMETPIKLNGSVITTVGAGVSGRSQWDHIIDIDFSLFDFVTNTQNFEFDDSGWAGKFFTPPDEWSSPPPWILFPPTAYFVGDVVAHESRYWQCTQDHTSAVDKEPGHAGGELYWTETGPYGWPEHTYYYWTTPRPFHVYIKPDYASW